MKVLVTGADGFVGQHLVEALLSRGHQVVGGITGSRPRPGTLPGPRAARVEWVRFDLLDAASIRALIARSAPEGVFHLAGISSVSRSWKHPEEAFNVNARGSLHLLLALRDLPAPGVPRPVLLVGSAEAYGRSGTEEAPLREDMALRPLTPYGASKGAQEMIGSALGNHPGLRVVQTRSFAQIGPGQKPAFVTADWARQLVASRRGERPPVLRVGNLEAVRDFLDVREAAAAYVALVECAEARDVYNVCSGRAYRLREVLEALQAAVGIQVDVEVDPERLRPADIASLVGDPRRLMEQTGWRPRRPLEEMVADIVADVERKETDGID